MDKRSSSRPNGPKQRGGYGSEPPKTEYQHKEAFCLMQYQCKHCHGTEILWNSRDGVTPFGIHCRICGGSMLHENWQADRFTPDHTPWPGQTWNRAAGSFREAGMATGIELPKGYTDESLAQHIAEGISDEEPWVIEWPR